MQIKRVVVDVMSKELENYLKEMEVEHRYTTTPVAKS